MSTSQNVRDRLLAIGLILCLAPTLVFWHVRGFEFLNLDDFANITQNPNYDPFSTQSLRRIWTEPYIFLYIPVTYTTWGVLSTVARVQPLAGEPPPANLDARKKSGWDPSIFHSFNLLLHVLNTLLVFILLRRWFKHDWAAAVGALFFSLHPLHVESVAWITEMKGLLSTFWCLAAFVLFEMWWSRSRPATTGENSDSGSKTVPKSQTVVLYILAAFCFLCAILSKPAAVILPLVIWVVGVSIHRQNAAATAKALAFWLCLAAPLMWFTRSIQSSGQEIYSPLWLRPLVALDALSFYLFKTLWPLELFTDYGRSPEIIQQRGWAFTTWVLPVGLAILLWTNRRRWQVPVTSFLVFIACLLPVLGLVPFAFQDSSTVADRYMYLPLLGFAMTCTWILSRTKSKGAWAAASVVLIALAALSYRQTAVWRDSLTLHAHTLKFNQPSWLTMVNMGNTLFERNRKAEAMPYYESALKYRPNTADVYNNIGIYQYEQGDYGTAVKTFEKAKSLAPETITTYFNLASAYEKLGQYDQAAINGRKFQELSPPSEQMKAHLSLFQIYTKAKRTTEAAGELESIKQWSPDTASYHAALAKALTNARQSKAAIPHFKAAIEASPGDSQLYSGLGEALIDSNNLDQALQYLHEAVKLSPENYLAYYQLGRAMEMRDNPSQARIYYEKTLKLKAGDSLALRALSKLKH